MTTGVIPDPFTNFNFLVEIDGITRAAFQECSGFDSTIDVIEHREGGATTPSKLAGLTKYSNIVLKRGITDDQELYDWHRDALRGQVVLKNGSIVLLDRGGQEKARWNFVRAWPSKWDGPDLNSEQSDVALESFEIVHEGIERA
jgi:phage tail-like protein